MQDPSHQRHARKLEGLPSLLIVDDHHMVRVVLAEALKASGVCRVVGESSTGAGAIEQSTQLNPDIVLLDAMMPGLSGLECVRLIRRSTPNVKIILFTGHSNPVIIGRAVELKLNGCIAKGSEFGELIEAIEVVAAGGIYCCKLLLSLVKKIKGLPFPLGAGSKLTEREHSILKGVAAGKSSKEIGDELGLSFFTVNNHRRRIKQKTGLKSVADFTLYALELGFVDNPPSRHSPALSEPVKVTAG